MDLCSTWDALVLIDEADIFLEARSSIEIQRNALVCVMLRLLEYYSGCLFLSSNRDAKSIDAAIASRITVMLNYPSLDLAGRAKVWKNLIELVPAVPIGEDGTLCDKITNNRRRLSKYRVNFTEEDYDNLSSRFSRLPPVALLPVALISPYTPILHIYGVSVLPMGPTSFLLTYTWCPLAHFYSVVLHSTR